MKPEQLPATWPEKMIIGIDPSKPTSQSNENGFMQKSHHDSTAYSRIENWIEDVKAVTMPTKFLGLSQSQADAIMKFYDEMKLLSAIEDQLIFENAKERGNSFDDVQWVEETYEKLWEQWSQEELVPLVELRQHMKKMFEGGKAYFVKLSIRSPKDAALKIKSVQKALKGSLSGSSSVQTKLRLAAEECWRALKSRDADYCLKLFLLSERVNTDLRAHSLFLEEDQKFNLKLAFREWYEWLHPYFEFRAFVVKGELTTITSYELFCYDPVLVQEQDRIRTNLIKFWKKHCQQQIRSENYCVDFCIDPENVDEICLIEVNNFLPPVAGTGQFIWHRKQDRDEVMSLPLSFRVPLEPCENFQRVYDVDDGKKILMKIPSEFENILKEFEMERKIRNFSIAVVLAFAWSWKCFS